MIPGGMIRGRETPDSWELLIMIARQCAALGLLIASGLILGAAQQDTAERASGNVYQPPRQPLDPRIDPAKVTEHDPPPLPQQLILPMPPQFRIAQRSEHGRAASGVPTGIQIVGRTYDDVSVFRAAAAYEGARGWLDAPDRRPLL